MPSYLHPGVYVEEIPSGSKPIEGVGTSTATFVGFTNKGPIGEPVLIQKWDDYVNRYGGIRKMEPATQKHGDPMGLSVSAFFQNGGGKAYIVRIVNETTNNHEKAVAYVDNPSDVGTGNALKFTAVNAGKWANGIIVKMAANDVDPNLYDVEIGRNDNKGEFKAIETFAGVSLATTEPRFIKNVIDDSSELVTVELVAAVPGSATSDEYVGASRGADMTGVSLDFSAWSAADRKLKLKIDGSSGWDTITVPKVSFSGLSELAAAIEAEVRKLASAPSDVKYANFTCTVVDNRLILTSGTRTATSSVEVDETTGIAGTLRLGLDPAVAYIGTSTSDNLAGVSVDFTGISDPAERSLSGIIDGTTPFTFELNGATPYADLAAVAAAIGGGVNGLSCAVVSDALVLTSDSHTPTSAVVINSAFGLAPILKLGVLPVSNGGAELTGRQHYERLLSDGTSTSGNVAGISLDFSAVSAADRKLSGSINGVPFAPLDLAASYADLAALATAIAGISGLSCAVVGNRLVLTPDTTGEAVVINSAFGMAPTLKLGVGNGGVEKNAANLAKNLRSEITGQQSADVASPKSDALDGGKDGDLPEVGDYDKVFTKFIKYRDINIICLPGQYWSMDSSGNPIISKAIAHAEKMKSRMVIVDPPPSHELTNALKVNNMGLPSQTYCVVYYPWVEVSNRFYHAERDPGLPKNVLVPPSGFAAGMWAKIDGKRGVWKAPAGMETGLLGASKLEFSVEDGEQDSLNPWGINCFRSMPGGGKVIWGSRTRATKADPEWRYVPVRRTAIMIEQSIYNGIQWAVFEPNDHRLWSALRANIGNFMNGLFRSGAFQGEKASDAYFVRCGLGDTMTQGDIDAGQVIVQVGFAPLKPAEFVIVRIQQKVGQE